MAKRGTKKGGRGGKGGKPYIMLSSLEEDAI